MTDQEYLAGLPPWFDVCAVGLTGGFGAVWIRSAAILQDGIVWEGARHHLIIRDIVAAGIKRATGEQGFMTNHGVFIDRAEAAKLALRNGQITTKLFNQTDLFSEELWIA